MVMDVFYLLIYIFFLLTDLTADCAFWLQTAERDKRQAAGIETGWENAAAQAINNMLGYCGLG